MRCRNNRYRISLAGPEHSQQLLKIYESGDFKGNISVLFTRRPDPYKSLIAEGENAVIPIVTDKTNGLIVGMGACIIRKAYINGKIKNTGYLTGLKVLPEYQKRVPYIPEVYHYLYEQTKDQVDIYYTTILNENINVQKMLEKKRNNMPEYNYQGEYTVFCFQTGITIKGKEYSLETGGRKDLETTYRDNSKSLNFSVPDINLYGVREEDIYVLRNRKGKAVAACAIWDRQNHKQYVITEYRGIYKYLKRLPLKLLGYPDFPKENSPINYGSIALLSVRNNDASIAEHFIKKLTEKATRFDFLILGFFQTHPLLAGLEKIKCIKYGSKLYTVHWDDNSVKLNDKPINLEAGFL